MRETYRGCHIANDQLRAGMTLITELLAASKGFSSASFGGGALPGEYRLDAWDVSYKTTTDLGLDAMI